MDCLCTHNYSPNFICIRFVYFWECVWLAWLGKNCASVREAMQARKFHEQSIKVRQRRSSSGAPGVRGNGCKGNLRQVWNSWVLGSVLSDHREFWVVILLSPFLCISNNIKYKIDFTLHSVSKWWVIILKLGNWYLERLNNLFQNERSKILPITYLYVCVLPWIYVYCLHIGDQERVPDAVSVPSCRAI